MEEADLWRTSTPQFAEHVCGRPVEHCRVGSDASQQMPSIESNRVLTWSHWQFGSCACTASSPSWSRRRRCPVDVQTRVSENPGAERQIDEVPELE